MESLIVYIVEDDPQLKYVMSDKDGVNFGLGVVNILKERKNSNLSNVPFRVFLANAIPLYSILVEIKNGNISHKDVKFINYSNEEEIEIRCDEEGNLETYPEIFNHFTNVLIKMI